MRKAFDALMFVLLLSAWPAGPAAADDFPPPDVAATGHRARRYHRRLGWNELVQGISGFSVEREYPNRIWPDVTAVQFSLYDGGLKPNTTYPYKVCAFSKPRTAT